MSMTHKEALRKADSVLAKMEFNGSLKELEAAIRAYIEARGLVLVPRIATDAMINAISDEYAGGLGIRVGIRAMLAAAPDPFKDDAA